MAKFFKFFLKDSARHLTPPKFQDNTISSCCKNKTKHDTQHDNTDPDTDYPKNLFFLFLFDLYIKRHQMYNEIFDYLIKT